MPELSLYASFSEGFLAQSGNQFTVLNTTSAALEAETFENLEADIKWSIRPELFLTAAIFRLTRDNTQAPDPLGSGLTVAVGEVRLRALSLALRVS